MTEIDLHTSASTILMSRFCTFRDTDDVPQDLLTSTWDLCLYHLSRYEGISSIASQSCRLLHESLNHLRNCNRSLRKVKKMSHLFFMTAGTDQM